MLTIDEYSMCPLEEKDLEQVLAWRNSDRIRSVMFTNHKISMQEHLTWFERIKKQEILTHFIFAYRNRPIGYISYIDIDRINGTCSSGTYLGEQAEIPKLAGIALEYFTTEYAFENLGMRKIWAYCFAYNKKILKLNKLFGCKQEGYLKKHVIKDGKYEDLVLVSMFYDDWKIKREVLQQYLFSEVNMPD